MATQWTEHAQAAINRSLLIAQQAGDPVVWPRHLALALLTAPTHAGDILLHLGLDLDAFRARLEEWSPCLRRRIETWAPPEFSPACQDIFQAAGVAAAGMGFDSAATEHLLLGILHDRLSSVARILADQGIQFDTVREMIVGASASWTLPARPAAAGTPGPPPWASHLSASTRQVLDIAGRRACSLFDHDVEPEDLLFALLHDAFRPVAAAVRNVGLDPVRWRGEEEIRAHSYELGFPLPPRISKGTRRVLDSAEGRATRLGLHGFGPEDLFVALIDVYPSLFTDNLQLKSIWLADLRHELLDLEGVDARWVTNSLAEVDSSAERVLEHLTPQARRVLAAAREEAWERGDDHLGTEHLLLALSRPGNGGAAAVLEHMGATHTRVREGLERLLGRSREGAFVDPLPPTTDLDNAIRVANKEAEKHEQEQVSTEALLTGVLWQRDSTAAKFLASLEVTIIRTRLKVAQIHDAALEYDAVGASCPMTCRARGILCLAQRRARESNLRAVDEALLFGAMLAQQGGLAIRALWRLGIDIDSLARDMKARAEGTRSRVLVPPELSPSVKRILDAAAGLPSGKGYTKVGSGEMLLAFLQEAESDRRNSLAQLGISPAPLARALAEVESPTG